ncbi:MAG: lytic transglycosylase domain-containing protein [Bryobacteraceae bacterium]
MRHILLAGVFLAAVTSAQVAPPAPAAPPADKRPAAQSPAGPPPAATAQSAPSTPSSPQSAPPQSAMPQDSKAPDQAAVQSSMADSLARQRVAAMKQIAGVMGKAPTPAASFFTVPWVETPVPFSSPPCDPMPVADLDKLVEQNSQQEGVKAELIRAVIAEESGARPCAVSWKGAQGMMQLMPATSEQFGVKDPFDPKQNVEAGTKLLKQLLTKYNNDVSLALAAYNAGEGRVDKDGAVPQIPETQNYVNDIQSKLPKK